MTRKHNEFGKCFKLFGYQQVSQIVCFYWPLQACALHTTVLVGKGRQEAYAYYSSSDLCTALQINADAMCARGMCSILYSTCSN